MIHRDEGQSRKAVEQAANENLGARRYVTKPPKNVCLIEVPEELHGRRGEQRAFESGATEALDEPVPGKGGG